MNTSARPNDPTSALWSVLRDFLAQAFSLFGAPHEIAQRSVALRSEHKTLLCFLRQCEALLRRLFFIEALALLPSIPPPARGRLGGGKHKRRYHEQDPENSETWRVRFRVTCASAQRTQCSPEPREARVEACPERAYARRRGKATSSSGRFTSTWPAAERLEALIRAFNDPAPYVRRLAHLIKRNAKRALAFLIEPQREYGKTPLEAEIETATQVAERRWRACDTS